MRKWIDIVEEQSDDIELYHGTSVPMEEIQKHGLQIGRLDAVFLTDNPELALEYAETDQDRTGFDTKTLVRVMASSLNPEFLIGDIDHTLEQNWQESLRETDQCMYMRSIPPEILSIEDYSD